MILMENIANIIVKIDEDNNKIRCKKVLLGFKLMRFLKSNKIKI